VVIPEDETGAKSVHFFDQKIAKKTQPRSLGC
jgi:hypothetical protein